MNELRSDSMTVGDAIDLALRYARLGVPAFPLALSAGSDGQAEVRSLDFRTATLDEDEVRELMRRAQLRSGEVPGVGVSLGAAGMVAVDAADARVNGCRTVRLVEPSGVRWAWFKAPSDEQIEGSRPWCVAPGTWSPWGTWATEGAGLLEGGPVAPFQPAKRSSPLGSARERPHASDVASTAPAPASVTAWPVLDERALFGLAGDIVAAVRPHSEADPVAVLVSLLTAFGNAVGSGPHVRVGGARHGTNLFSLLVGATSRARKGTSWADTKPFLHSADSAWLTTRVLGGLSTGEGLIAAVRDPHVDGKGEVTDQGVADKRLLAVEPEFARVLAGVRREGNTLSAIAREAWDGGVLQVLTKASPARASGAHVSIMGHITLEELQAKLTETDIANGLVNRFLIVAVRRTQRLPEGGYLGGGSVSLLGNRLRHALEEARRHAQIHRTAPAAELWADLYGRMADDDPGGLLGAAVARAEAQVLRLSLVYALLDSAPAIDTQHLDAAWAFWRYCRASAEHVFGDAVGDHIADELLRNVRSAGAAGLDATSQHQLFHRNVSRERLAQARQRLEADGRIVTRAVPGERGGRPRTISWAARAAPGAPS